MEAPFGETDSEFSTEGTMLHKLFLTGERPESLTAEQKQTLDMADFYAGEFFETLCESQGIPPETEYFDERDSGMMLRDLDGGELFPGHADVIRKWKGYKVRAIVDAKFGFMEVDHAPDNLQLASYFAMREQQATPGGFGSKTATGVAITQPRNFGPRMTQALYAGISLSGVIGELAGIVRASEQPEAPLIAGDKQCHFCKAKTVCQAYTAKFGIVETADPSAIATVADDQLERLHIAISFAAKIGPEVREEMRRRIEAGKMPGWKLQNSGDDVTLKDSLAFFEELQRYAPKLTASAYDECREIQWGRLTDLMQPLLSLSEKKAKDLLKTVSAPFATRTPKAMKIVRDKSAAPLALE